MVRSGSTQIDLRLHAVRGWFKHRGELLEKLLISLQRIEKERRSRIE
ncbi:hypothetical protein D3OALGA1CA_315 [Olavius algarvensis associated proteobacterium Delta 3]|nr:hypothetical protein D3OALGA1CA_315 [Olavius algarvensis associated proteobacterium Delta 3]CAB5098036.1 hypothetical protein D3OALGB2SA_1645 [Olavius algarvensis associated proteobacterium Delta 3]